MSVNIDIIEKNISEIKRNIENIEFFLKSHVKTKKKKKNNLIIYETNKKNKENKWSKLAGIA